jgi:DNA-binding PadR family transcriptional regulator
MMRSKDELMSLCDQIIVRMLAPGSMLAQDVASNILRAAQKIDEVEVDMLYRALFRLQSHQWIDAEWGRGVEQATRRYSLTPGARKLVPFLLGNNSPEAAALPLAS